MKQPPIKTKELSGSTVQIADGQNWEIASITAYGENAQGGTTEAPVALTGVDSVQVCGRNLLPMATSSQTLNGITCTSNSDGSVTIKGTATGWSTMVIDGDFSLPAGTYTLNSNTQTTGVGLSISKDVGGTQNIATSSTTSKTFTLPDLIKHYVAHIVVRPNSVVDTTIYPMLNLGSTAMPYEPYQGSVTTLPIPRPLRRVGDVKDKCVTRQDYESAEKLVVTYNVGFVELDGTEGVSLGNIDASADVQQFNIYGVLSSPNNSENAICSHFERANVSGGVDSGFQIYNTLLVFGMPRDILLEYGFITGDSDTYVPAFKAYLAAQNTSGTPVQVAYQLASPETYATDPVDFDNTAGPLTIMTGGELEVTLTHRMLTPYTTWAIRYDSEGEYTGDFFNVEDYDRIKQNIEYLREYAYFLYGGFTMRGMVAVTVESYGYASTIDALDANLEAIAANTFRPPDMMPVKQWRGNQPPPGADDWNRIENTCLLLFEQFERQFACLPKLAFELKGSAF